VGGWERVKNNTNYGKCVCVGHHVCVCVKNCRSVHTKKRWIYRVSRTAFFVCLYSHTHTIFLSLLYYLLKCVCVVLSSGVRVIFG